MQTKEERNTSLRERYKKSPEAFEARKDRYASTVRGRASRLFQAVKYRAKKYGLPVEIDAAWIAERLALGACPLTGICFDLRALRGALPYAPSVDRISPARGYTKDNSRVVITAANLAKNVWDDSTLLEWAKALVSKHESAHQESSV